MSNHIFPFSLAILLVSSSFTFAQDSWFPKPAEKSDARSSTFFGSSTKSKTSFSSLFKLPSWSKPTNSKPSMLSRMTSTSKRWWDNTTDFLNPFNDGKPAKKPEQTDWWSERNKPKEESKGMFSWMRGEEQKEKKITTVNDFLSLPMPY